MTDNQKLMGTATAILNNASVLSDNSLNEFVKLGQAYITLERGKHRNPGYSYKIEGAIKKAEETLAERKKNPSGL